MELKKRLENVLSKAICDNCLGRVFAQVLSGLTNKERGEVLRKFSAFLVETKEISDVEPCNFIGFKFRLNKEFGERVKNEKNKKCCFCDGIFEKVENITERIVKRLKNIEFDTFLVGTRLSKEMLEKEEELWKLGGLDLCESLRAELNREIGKLLGEKLKKEHDPKNPEVVILLNWELGNPKIEIQLNPLYIFGYYQKLVRGIPQCKWGTPRKYKTSVEQIIGKPLLRETKGKDTKFHGCGREDIDAKCLGWRPFVIEIISPKKRKVNLRKIAKEINSTKKVRVKNLKIVSRKVVEKIKSASPDKTYRVTVVFEKPVDKKILKNLNKLVGVIKQRTPLRVLHRRSDIMRRREVKKISWKVISPKKVELKIKCSAGLYVKELVSGDNGRTRPSVAEIIGIPARVKELDVIEIEKIKI